MSTNLIKLQSPLTLSQSVSAWLFTGKFKIFKVHSVFRNGFNLVSNHSLLFVGRNCQDLSAFGLQIDGKAFDQLHAYLKAGMMVKISTEKALFYSRPQMLELSFQSARRVDLELKTYTISQPALDSLQAILQSAQVFEESAFGKDPRLERMVQQWRTQALDDADLVRSLVGAGIGLTPSGDDFLQGMVLMDKVLRASHYWQQLCQQVLRDRSTTDVSQAYYQALFAGQVNQSWLQLLQALSQADEAGLQAAVSSIQAYGASSGNDILYGIRNYLTTFRRLDYE